MDLENCEKKKNVKLVQKKKFLESHKISINPNKKHQEKKKRKIKREISPKKKREKISDKLPEITSNCNKTDTGK